MRTPDNARCLVSKMSKLLKRTNQLKLLNSKKIKWSQSLKTCILAASFLISPAYEFCCF